MSDSCPECVDRQGTLGLAKGRVAASFARHRFLIVFAAMSSFMGIGVGIAQVTTSLFAVKLGSNETTLGLIAGSQSVGMLVISLPAGMLVDRFGPAALFVVGSVVCGAIYAVTGFVASPAGLLIATAAISFFMPLRFVSLNTVFLRQLATLGEARAGWYRGTHMVGMFLVGPTVAAKLIGWLGFHGTYLLIAAAFTLAALISRIVFNSYSGETKVTEPLRWNALRTQLASLVRDPELRRLSLLEAASQAIGAYFTFFIVVIAVKLTGLGTASATSLVSAKGLSYIVALFALGGIVERLGARRAYLASLLLIVGALVLLGFAGGIDTLWIGSLAIGLGLGTLQIVNLTGYSRAARRAGHGKVSGVNALAWPVGALTGNLCGGLVGSAIGLQAAFFVFAGALGLLGVYSARRLSKVPL